MQKWEYAVARLWSGSVINTNVAGKIEKLAELKRHGGSSQPLQLEGKPIAVAEWLNSMGEQGWELVAIHPIETHNATSTGGVSTDWHSEFLQCRAVLKRPR